ncbi:hypothetical protein WJX74_001230 [Apatococcus lobatus]|uniref:EF-hand domain-containing protein n=1 Tax=Apatococcus lobatus TaxID=904363 RepID=A0AAW1QBN6_9CHLO
MGSRFRSGCDKAAQRYVLSLASSRSGLIIAILGLLAWSVLLLRVGGALSRPQDAWILGEPIDAVYTWVNGSDPAFIASKMFHKQNELRGTDTHEDAAQIHVESEDSRFRDNDELRFSLRSLEQHAPWLRHIYIVTNGQVPTWLDRDNPRLSIVAHQEIFTNRSHLPTFSSSAIEVHLHRIKGLSNKFLYFNDDVFLMKPVYPDDFYTLSGGQKLFFTWDVPPCAGACHSKWIGDGFCDTACNVTSCAFDGGDCANVTRNSQFEAEKKCSPSCMLSWLGDRYCDAACNVASCGFDLGDCGLDGIKEAFQSVDVMQLPDHLDVYNESAIYFNLSSTYPHVQTFRAYHTTTKAVSAVRVSQKLQVLIVLFAPAFSRADSSITITLSGLATQEAVHFWGPSHVRNGTAWLAPPNSTQIRVMTDYSLQSAQPGARGLQPLQLAFNFTKHYDPTHIRPESPPAPEPRRRPTNSMFDSRDMFADLKEHDDRWLDEDDYDADWDDQYSFRHQVMGPPMRPPPRTPNPVWSSMNDLSSPGDPPSSPQMPSQSRDFITSSSVKETGGLSSKTARHSLLEAGQPEEAHGSDTSGGSATNVSHTASAVTKTAVGSTSGSEAASGHSSHARPASQGALGAAGHDMPGEAEVLVRGQEDLHGASRRLLDVFGESLRHVDNLLNARYGGSDRKVLAHMPHLLDRTVLTEMMAAFPKEFDTTSSHKFRSGDDMQYAFAYYHFLALEQRRRTPQEVMADGDLDGDGRLSSNELQTLILQYKRRSPAVTWRRTDTTLSRSEVLKVLREIQSSTTIHPAGSNEMLPIPITHLAAHQSLVQLLEQRIGWQPVHKSQEGDAKQVGFIMLTSNLSLVQQDLDRVRANPPKFLCLNDNFNDSISNSQQQEEVQNFLQAFFPNPSSFEQGPRAGFKSLIRLWHRHRRRIRAAMLLAMAGVAAKILHKRSSAQRSGLFSPGAPDRLPYARAP